MDSRSARCGSLAGLKPSRYTRQMREKIWAWRIVRDGPRPVRKIRQRPRLGRAQQPFAAQGKAARLQGKDAAFGLGALKRRPYNYGKARRPVNRGWARLCRAPTKARCAFGLGAPACGRQA